MLDDEAIQVGGSNHSHATQDLYDNIADGNYPEWTLYIQTMDPTDEDKFDFDPLDVTKIWPENLFPLQPVGRMVLNQNPSNFFSENEMLVSCFSLVSFCHTKAAIFEHRDNLQRSTCSTPPFVARLTKERTVLFIISHFSHNKVFKSCVSTQLKLGYCFLI